MGNELLVMGLTAVGLVFLLLGGMFGLRSMLQHLERLHQTSGRILLNQSELSARLRQVEELHRELSSRLRQVEEPRNDSPQLSVPRPPRKRRS